MYITIYIYNYVYYNVYIYIYIYIYKLDDPLPIFQISNPANFNPSFFNKINQ